MFPKVLVALFVTLLAAVAQAAPNPDPAPTPAPVFEPSLEDRQSACFFYRSTQLFIYLFFPVGSIISDVTGGGTLSFIQLMPACH